MWNTGYTLNWMLDFGENMAGKMVGEKTVKWFLDVTYLTYWEQFIRVIDVWMNGYLWEMIFGSKKIEDKAL